MVSLVNHIMINRTLKILALAALIISCLVPFEAQGVQAASAGFVEKREGKIEATGLTVVFPEDRKRVSIPIVSDDDSINPQGSRVG